MFFLLIARLRDIGFGSAIYPIALGLAPYPALKIMFYIVFTFEIKLLLTHIYIYIYIYIY